MPGEAQLTAASGGGSAAFVGPPTSSAHTKLKLPADTGSAGQVLKIKSANHSATNAELEWAADSGGKILQVVQVSSKDHLSSTSTSYVDLPGVTASITPSSTDNKILIICSIAISKAANHSFIGRIVRDGSAITGAGGEKESGHTNQVDGSWWTIRSTIHDASPCTVTYLDSPSSTSSLTYKAQGSTTDASQGFGFNLTFDSQNSSYASPGFSSILLMEIAT